MARLPKGTRLGDLSIIEVFDYYDEPVVFSCRNTVGQRYLATFCDRNQDFDTWLYVAVSESSYSRLLAGLDNLDSPFKEPETGFVELVRRSRQGGVWELTSVKTAEIAREWIPLEGESLLSDEEQARTQEEMVLGTAQKVGRTVVNLHLFPRGVLDNTAPAKAVGLALTALQDLLDSIGQAVLGRPTTSGRISQDVVEQMRFLALPASAGSYSIDLIAEAESDMFDQSAAGNAVERFGRLLQNSQNVVELREDFLELRGRAASRFRRFLEVFVEDNTDFAVHWSTGLQGMTDSVTMTAQQAATTAATLARIEVQQPEPEEVVGRLDGVVLETRYFRLEERITGRNYTGRIADQALTAASTALINGIYRATLLPTLEIDEMTGDERTKWQLVSLLTVEAPPEPLLER